MLVVLKDSSEPKKRNHTYQGTDITRRIAGEIASRINGAILTNDPRISIPGGPHVVISYDAQGLSEVTPDIIVETCEGGDIVSAVVAFVVIQLTALQNQKFATLQQNTMQPPGDPDANADSASCK